MHHANGIAMPQEPPTPAMLALTAFSDIELAAAILNARLLLDSLIIEKYKRTIAAAPQEPGALV
jgi:hypothetical protein